jgi:hypothetical protein
MDVDLEGDVFAVDNVFAEDNVLTEDNVFAEDWRSGLQFGVLIALAVIAAGLLAIL